MCEHRERAARTRRLIKSGICFFARTTGMPHGSGQTTKLPTRSDRGLVSVFHCRRRVRWQSWANEACDFLCSAEAVISRLCLICRVAMSPVIARCATSQQDVFHQETSKSETFRNQPAPRQTFTRVLASYHTVTATFCCLRFSHTGADQVYYVGCDEGKTWKIRSGENKEAQWTFKIQMEIQGFTESLIHFCKSLLKMCCCDALWQCFAILCYIWQRFLLLHTLKVIEAAFIYS